jgi:hypothetical protein
MDHINKAKFFLHKRTLWITRPNCLYVICKLVFAKNLSFLNANREFALEGVVLRSKAT